jgi:hypothetical protein
LMSGSLRLRFFRVGVAWGSVEIGTHLL